MSKIKNLVAKETTTWVDFPDIDGFEVNIRFLNREDLMKVRNASLTYKFNKLYQIKYYKILKINTLISICSSIIPKRMDFMFRKYLLNH